VIWLWIVLGLCLANLVFFLGICVGYVNGKEQVRKVEGEEIWHWLFRRRNEAPMGSGEEEAFKEAHEMIEHWQLMGRVG